MADTVRRLAAGLLPSGRCSLEHVAALLGLQGRTLQRQLAEEGVQFTELLHELRLELATRYLAEGRRPLTQVAQLLGFASISAFSRWYSNRTGTSPSVARQGSVVATASVATEVAHIPLFAA